ncbi:MAG: HIT family protein, partial [Candidatus Omnitrophica bacterium CG07_land_8_20_14_0_80_50_8]
IPCHKLFEDEKYFSFLDIRPINPGHALVIPKQAIDYIFDLKDADLGDMIIFSKKIARAIKKAVPCKKVGMMAAGLEVPHAHIHLIPLVENVHELSFANAKAAAEEALASMAECIRHEID